MTTYRGFSAVSGETTFTQDMADIKNGKHAKLIIKIASLVAQGKVEEARNVLSQLVGGLLKASELLEPFLPETSTKIQSIFTADEIVPPSMPLFPKA